MEVIERRVVYQSWYETEFTKTGWDSHGWIFEDGNNTNGWDIVEHLRMDKFFNPIIGIAEKRTKI